jgi:hypothetical protein
MSNRRLPSTLLSPNAVVDGELDGVFETIDQGMVRVTGSAAGRPLPVEVVFIDRDGRQQSEILLQVPRRTGLSFLRATSPAEIRWEGYVRWHLDKELWVPRVRVAGDRMFYPLRRNEEVEDRLARMAEARASGRP